MVCLREKFHTPYSDKYFRLPDRSLEEIKSLHPELDVKTTKDGQIERVVGSADNLARVLSYCYAFHVDHSHQLYITLAEGDYEHVTADTMNKLILDTLHHYGFPRGMCHSEHGVLRALVTMTESKGNFLEPRALFRPQEWDGERRMEGFLRHFFTLEGLDADRQNWAFLTTLFQWYGVLNNHPGAGFSVSPVLLSTQQGIGKSMFLRLLGSFSDRYKPLEISGWGAFNDRAVMELIPQSSVLIYDEMSPSALRRHYDTAKRIATQTHFTINPKYQPSYDYKRVQPLFLSTNNSDVLPDEANRRFPIIRVTVNPESPLRFGITDDVKDYVQQVFNEVAYVFEHASPEDQMALMQWEAKDNAMDADESKLEIVDAVNRMVFRHCNTPGIRKRVTIREFYSKATAAEANVLIKAFCRDKTPLPETTQDVGEALYDRMYRGSFAKLIDGYNDLVSKDYHHEVISTETYKTTQGQRQREIRIENHRWLDSDNPEDTPSFHLEHVAPVVTARREILDRVFSEDNPLGEDLFHDTAKVWCVTQVAPGKDGKLNKVPHSALTGKPLYGSFDTDERAAQLANFNQAQAFVKNHPGFQLALNIDRSVPIICLDVDGSKVHKDFFPSGVGIETSVSGTGQHIYYRVPQAVKHRTERFGKRTNGKVYLANAEGDLEYHKADIFVSTGVVTVTNPDSLKHLDAGNVWHLNTILQSVESSSGEGAYSETAPVSASGVVPDTAAAVTQFANGYMNKHGLVFEEGSRHNVAGRLLGAASAIGISQEFIPVLEEFIEHQAPDWEDRDQDVAGWIDYITAQSGFGGGQS